MKRIISLEITGKERNNSSAVNLLRPGLFAFAAFFAFSCGLIPDQVDVDIEYPLAVAGGLASVQPEPLPGVGSKVRQTLSNEGVPTDKIEAVRITRLELVHFEPRCEGQIGCDLGFIETLEVFAESPDIDEVMLGNLQSPGNVRLAAMDRQDVDLTEFILADEMSFTASIRMNARPIQNISMEIRATIQADIDVF